MHCDIVQLADQLRRQVRVVGDVPLHLLVRRRRHLYHEAHTRIRKTTRRQYINQLARTHGGNAGRQGLRTKQRAARWRDGGADLLAVALREVDDARAEGGEADERAGAGVPQLRVEVLLLCTRTHAQQMKSA